MLKFYHHPQTRSSGTLWLLEELGVPFETEIVDIRAPGGPPESYRAIQPNKKVPAIVHDGTIVTERAAIAIYLADTFPEAKLAPPIGHRLRAQYLTALVYVDGVLDSVLAARAQGLKYEGNQYAFGSFDDAMANLEKMLWEHDYAVGNEFTAADTHLGSALFYGVHMLKVIPEKPLFQAYLDRLQQRPAFQRFMRKEQMPLPA